MASIKATTIKTKNLLAHQIPKYYTEPNTHFLSLKWI